MCDGDVMRILRRFGGLRRVLLLVGGLLCTAYFVQYILFSHNTKPFNSNGGLSNQVRSMEISNGSTQPIFVPLQSKENASPQIESVCPSSSNSCKENGISVFVSTSHTSQPVICVNKKSFSNSCQGVIVNIIEGSEVENKCFSMDSTHDDESQRELLAFIAQLTPAKTLILVTYAFSALRLDEETKLVLGRFGAKDLKQYSKPYSLLVIGKRGLSSGAAIQRVGDEADGAISFDGCVTFSDGDSNKKDTSIKPPTQNKTADLGLKYSKIVYGNFLPNCGKESCPPDSMSVSVYSGRSKDDHPKMCIDGRIVMENNLNGAGRGLNIAVVDSVKSKIRRIAHFDTYLEDSSALEVFLEQIAPGETVVILSFDEASNRLSTMAKQMFYELGSALIQNLKFRASWYFVGQKGLSGFSPFEQLNFASGNDWAPPVDTVICVPNKLEGQKIRPDPIGHAKNDKRRHFCMQYDGYEDFCDGLHVDELLLPTPQFNKSWIAHDIYKVPIAIVGGLAHNSLRMTLQTLIKQQGVNPNLVTVFYDDNYPEGGDLAELFGFSSHSINASASYSMQMIKALDAIWRLYPTAEEAIVIEEELLLTADFLVFMGQLLPVIRKDPTISTVSAWNDNGFVPSSTRPDLVYRIEWLPGMAFMITKRVYTKELKDRMDQCCNVRAWKGWLNDKERSLWGAHSLVPDVSRVVRRHQDGLSLIQPDAQYLFDRDRAFTTQSFVQLSEVPSLLRANYEVKLNQSIIHSQPLSLKSHSCLNAKQDSVNMVVIDKSVKAEYLSVYFEQSAEDEYKALRIIAKCFGLYSPPNGAPRGIFMAVLRFSYEGKQVFLVSSRSPFYNAKPSSLYPLRIN